MFFLGVINRRWRRVKRAVGGPTDSADDEHEDDSANSEFRLNRTSAIRLSSALRVIRRLSQRCYTSLRLGALAATGFPSADVSCPKFQFRPFAEGTIS